MGYLPGHIGNGTLENPDGPGLTVARMPLLPLLLWLSAGAAAARTPNLHLPTQRHDGQLLCSSERLDAVFDNVGAAGTDIGASFSLCTSSAVASARESASLATGVEWAQCCRDCDCVPVPAGQDSITLSLEPGWGKQRESGAPADTWQQSIVYQLKRDGLPAGACGSRDVWAANTRAAAHDDEMFEATRRHAHTLPATLRADLEAFAVRQRYQYINEESAGGAPEVVASAPFPDPADRRWSAVVALLEERFPDILQEMKAIPSDAFVHEEEGIGERGVWDKIMLLDFGRRQNLTCERFGPVVCSILDSLVAETASCGACRVLYSRLKPGSSVHPHAGPTNTRLRLHLGLQTNLDAGVVAAHDQRRVWSVGKVLVLDDSFEHFVYNNGTKDRVILLFDIWHPATSPARKQKINELMGPTSSSDGERDMSGPLDTQPTHPTQNLGETKQGEQCEASDATCHGGVPVTTDGEGIYEPRAMFKKALAIQSAPNASHQDYTEAALIYEQILSVLNTTSSLQQEPATSVVTKKDIALEYSAGVNLGFCLHRCFRNREAQDASTRPLQLVLLALQDETELSGDELASLREHLVTIAPTAEKAADAGVNGDGEVQTAALIAEAVNAAKSFEAYVLNRHEHQACIDDMAPMITASAHVPVVQALFYNVMATCQWRLGLADAAEKTHRVALRVTTAWSPSIQMSLANFLICQGRYPEALDLILPLLMSLAPDVLVTPAHNERTEGSVSPSLATELDAMHARWVASGTAARLHKIHMAESDEKGPGGQSLRPEGQGPWRGENISSLAAFRTSGDAQWWCAALMWDSGCMKLFDMGVRLAADLTLHVAETSSGDPNDMEGQQHRLRDASVLMEYLTQQASSRPELRGWDLLLLSTFLSLRNRAGEDQPQTLAAAIRVREEALAWLDAQPLEVVWSATKQYANYIDQPPELWSSLDNKLSLTKMMGALDRHHPDLAFYPTTYHMPSELTAWRDYSERQPATTWITKLVDSYEAYGVRLVANEAELDAVPLPPEGLLLQAFVDKPMYYQRRRVYKARCFTMVTSVQPLRAMALMGYVAVHPHQNQGNRSDHGPLGSRGHGAWLPEMRFHDLLRQVESGHGKEASTLLWTKVRRLMFSALSSALTTSRSPSSLPAMLRPKLLGFDILVDDSLQPSLLEVERWPDLSQTSGASPINRTSSDWFQVLWRAEALAWQAEITIGAKFIQFARTKFWGNKALSEDELSMLLRSEMEAWAFRQFEPMMNGEMVPLFPFGDDIEEARRVMLPALPSEFQYTAKLLLWWSQSHRAEWQEQVGSVEDWAGRFVLAPNATRRVVEVMERAGVGSPGGMPPQSAQH